VPDKQEQEDASRKNAEAEGYSQNILAHDAQLRRGHIGLSANKLVIDPSAA
jgi:hypothetical protein